jgi:hypothetical protein
MTTLVHRSAPASEQSRHVLVGSGLVVLQAATAVAAFALFADDYPSVRAATAVGFRLWATHRDVAVSVLGPDCEWRYVFTPLPKTGQRGSEKRTP